MKRRKQDAIIKKVIELQKELKELYPRIGVHNLSQMFELRAKQSDLIDQLIDIEEKSMSAIMKVQYKVLQNISSGDYFEIIKDGFDRESQAIEHAEKLVRDNKDEFYFVVRYTEQVVWKQSVGAKLT